MKRGIYPVTGAPLLALMVLLGCAAHARDQDDTANTAAEASSSLSLQRATITVTDLELSLSFYTDVMGMTLSSRAAYDTPSMRTLFSLSGAAKPELALLDANPEQPRAIALVHQQGHAVDTQANRQHAPALVLNTGDMDALHARALAAGVDVLLPPTPLNDFSGKPFGREAAYFDPDGVRIVVFQYD